MRNRDFRVQIFNTFGVLGFALGVVFGTFSLIVHHETIYVISNYGAATVAAVVIWRANRTKNFKRYFLVTVISVFFLIFPILFFWGGGYASGMPCFFVFAVVFTVIMLEGGRRIVFTVLEIMLYSACFITAYFRPETVISMSSDKVAEQDTIVGTLAVAIVLAIAIYQHIIVYDRKQKELKKANDALSGLNRMKTEFLQDIKHEIRKPLHIISLGTDYIGHCIDKGGGAEEAREALNSVQNEAMRLGRMINGMVELATMNETPTNRERVDLAALLRDTAEASRIQMKQKRNALRVEIAPGLPYVYAEAGQLERVVVNLFSNANDSTQDGGITLKAFVNKNYIVVVVQDTGEGVTAALMPGVFERGVSGKGGKGYGLSICKTIVEAHGGVIEIESEAGKGTAVTFTIPVYGGQGELRTEK